MTPRTVRRTLDASRLTIDGLLDLILAATEEGLTGDAIVGFKKHYADGWRIDFTAHGESAITALICPECRDGKCPNCTGWSIDSEDNIVDCRCTHGK